MRRVFTVVFEDDDIVDIGTGPEYRLEDAALVSVGSGSPYRFGDA